MQSCTCKGTRKTNTGIYRNDTIGILIYYKIYKRRMIQMPKNMKIHRIGEKRMQNCGLEAEIIDYHNADNMTIQFSNGTETHKKNYKEFVKGRLCPPNQPRNKYKRISEKQMQNCGLEAEIIGYQMAKDMVIMFSDNIIINNKEYQSFQEGRVGHPTISPHFHRYIGRVYPKDRSKIYYTEIHGIAYIINNVCYYFCHCPICNAHEIWTFNKIKDHKCNHSIVKERNEIAQAYIATIRPTQ